MTSAHSYSPVNPGYTVDELLHTLQLVGVSLVVTSSASLDVAVSAARQAGISPDRVVTIDTPAPNHLSVEDLITAGLQTASPFVERRLLPGEGKTKVAFYCFSSGTTGKPKAVAVSHYAMIANILQVRACFMQEPRYGGDNDVVLGGEHDGCCSYFHI